MESTQLRHIQSIENSLTLLRSKIQKMAKLDSEKEETLDKLILNTIPIVDKKLQEEKRRQRIEKRKDRYEDKVSILRKRNQESRMTNEQEIAKSKEWISMVKQHNSMHLKQSKKINEEKIKKIKELNLNDKKEQKLKIKEQQQKSQIRIRAFHQQKQKQLKDKRQLENKENQQKIDSLMQELSLLGQKQHEMESKVRTSEQHIHKFRNVVNKMDKMKCDQFKKFRETVINPQNKYSSRSLSEAILLYTANTSS